MYVFVCVHLCPCLRVGEYVRACICGQRGVRESAPPAAARSLETTVTIATSALEFAGIADPRCPMCKFSEDEAGGLWLQCDGCDMWWHASCAGVQRATVSDASSWYCYICAERDVSADVKQSQMDAVFKAPSRLRSMKISCLLQFCKWTGTPPSADTAVMRQSLIDYFIALQVSRPFMRSICTLTHRLRCMPTGCAFRGRLGDQWATRFNRVRIQ
jgi:hypothetical protein